MRILVDASFPEDIEGPHAGGRHVIDRYRGGSIDDRALVRHACEHGYDTLVLMGPGALAEEGVIAEARSLPITVAVTYETDPDRAQEILKSRLHDLSKKQGDEVVIVRSRTVESVHPSPEERTNDGSLRG